jgi:hypothetical protein
MRAWLERRRNEITLTSKKCGSVYDLFNKLPFD